MISKQKNKRKQGWEYEMIVQQLLQSPSLVSASNCKSSSFMSDVIDSE